MRCNNCGKEHYEFYKISNKLWKEANGTSAGILCFPCLESKVSRVRVARSLKSFAKVPVNVIYAWLINAHGDYRNVVGKTRNQTITIDLKQSEVLMGRPSALARHINNSSVLHLSTLGTVPLVNFIVPLAKYYRAERIILKQNWVREGQLHYLKAKLKKFKLELVYHGTSKKK